MQLGDDLAVDRIRNDVWRRVRDAICAPVEVAMDELFEAGVGVGDVHLRIGPSPFQQQLVVRRGVAGRMFDEAVFEVVATFDMGGASACVVVTERWLVPKERLCG